MWVTIWCSCKSDKPSIIIIILYGAAYPALLMTGTWLCGNPRIVTTSCSAIWVSSENVEYIIIKWQGCSKMAGAWVSSLPRTVSSLANQQRYSQYVHNATAIQGGNSVPSNVNEQRCSRYRTQRYSHFLSGAAITVPASQAARSLPACLTQVCTHLNPTSLCTKALMLSRGGGQPAPDRYCCTPPDRYCYTPPHNARAIYPKRVAGTNGEPET